MIRLPTTKTHTVATTTAIQKTVVGRPPNARAPSTRVAVSAIAAAVRPRYECAVKHWYDAYQQHREADERRHVKRAEPPGQAIDERSLGN